MFSRNDLKDGVAHVFQFHENSATGYSISIFLYDFKGAGRYALGGPSRNHLRYIPNALGGTVITTRAAQLVKKIPSVELDSPETIAGFVDILDGPADLMGHDTYVGVFRSKGLGSDNPASLDDAADHLFVEAFTGVFRAPTLKAEAIPKVALRAPIGMAAPPPPPADAAPLTGLKVAKAGLYCD